MSEQSISRRNALIAAASLGTAVAVADAQGQDQDTLVQKAIAVPAQFKISIKLPDGQTVTFNATEATIDLGLHAQLLVTPSGVLPTVVGGRPPVFEPTMVPKNETFEPEDSRGPRGSGNRFRNVPAEPLPVGKGKI